MCRRPRWRDAGAAALDGSSSSVASESIGQACTFSGFSAPSSPAGRGFACGEIRGAPGNWRVRQLGS